MKIGIDARCLLGGNRTGVGEYAINILENIFASDKKNEYVVFLNSFAKLQPELNWVKKFPNVKIKIFRFPNKLLNFLFWYLSWPKIDWMLGGVDIFFMPNINFAAVSRKTKLIVTAHDLSFERFRETFSFKRRLWHFFISPKKLFRRADRIIAVSKSTAEDLRHLYGINLEKISIIHNGVSENFFSMDRNNPELLEVKEKYSLPFKFILFLGTIEPRKNIIALIRSYEILRKTQNEELKKYKLVLAGGKGWKSGEIFREIGKSSYKDDIIVTGFVDDKDKNAIYNLSSLFVYPSFFEGFGFPPLEAMKCGVPVVSSNSSSFPEVVDDGGIMIDPEHPEEIFLAMQELLLNPDFCQKMAKKGFDQAGKFSWKKSAIQTLKVFQK